MTTSFDVTSSMQEGIQNNRGTLVAMGTLLGISAFTLLAALLIGSAQRTRRRRRTKQGQVVQETIQTVDAPFMDRSEIELVFGRHNRHAWEMSEKSIATHDLKSVSMEQSKPTFWEDMKADPVLEAMMRQAQSGLFVLPGREQ